ncbi:MAG: zinc ribbon domain-containing protein [Acidobacteria bacterium]|nr:zinc ribbon domain-containing protein [Acidobacteriota bacterium]
MFCPRCGAENAEAASFCRGCGSNISLVPREDKKPPSIDGAVVPFFGGIGFILVALAVMLLLPGGHMWGFWMFIPAFFMIGAGVSEYLRLKEHQKQARLPGYAPPASIPAPPPPRAAELPTRRDTSEFYPPGSVTEGTTKLLDRDQ